MKGKEGGRGGISSPKVTGHYTPARIIPSCARTGIVDRPKQRREITLWHRPRRSCCSALSTWSSRCPRRRYRALSTRATNLDRARRPGTYYSTVLYLSRLPRARCRPCTILGRMPPGLTFRMHSSYRSVQTYHSPGLRRNFFTLAVVRPCGTLTRQRRWLEHY